MTEKKELGINPDDQEQNPNPEDALDKANALTESMSDIKKQVDNVQQAKELNIKKRADKIETLYHQTRGISQQIESLHTNLEYYQKNQDSLDDASRKTWKITYDLFDTLRTQRAVLDGIISTFYSDPSVQKEIRGRAETENKQRDIDKLTDEAKSKYSPKMIEFADQIKNIARDLNYNRDKLKEDEQKLEKQTETFWADTKNTVKEKHFIAIKDAFEQDAGQDYFKFRKILNQKAGRFGEAGAFGKINQNEEIQNKLGDIIGNKHQGIEQLGRNIDSKKTQLSNLPDTYMKVMGEIETDVQSKLHKLGSDKDIVGDFNYEFKDLIKKEAEAIWAAKNNKKANDVKGSDYNGWYELTNTDSRIATMYNVMSEIEEKVKNLRFNPDRYKESQ